MVEAGLVLAGIPYKTENDNDKKLDFYLPTLDIYIECKQFHTPRTLLQLAKADNVIIVQGKKSAEWLVDILEKAGARSV